MFNPYEAIDARLSNIECLLLDIKHGAQNAQPKEDELLSIQQAAEYVNLAVPTIYSLVSRNEIPVCKKSKRIYFSKSDLYEWIKNGRQKNFDEVGLEADNYLNRKS